jgi:hypothetical protein
MKAAPAEAAADWKSSCTLGANEAMASEAGAEASAAVAGGAAAEAAEAAPAPAEAAEAAEADVVVDVDVVTRVGTEADEPAEASPADAAPVAKTGSAGQAAGSEEYACRNAGGRPPPFEASAGAALAAEAVAEGMETTLL